MDRRARARFPRIVLVSFDTLNVQFTDPYLTDPYPPQDLTPHLAAFAREGVLFEQAHTRVPLTLPSHTAILTGRSPLHTGVMLNGDTVPAGFPTWAELLRDRGWATGAFVSLGVLKERFGLARGFDTYDDRIEEAVPRWYLTGAEVLERIRPWPDRHRREPFFLWVHLSDPHRPYLPDDPPPDTRLLLDGEPLGAWSLTTRERHSVRFELSPGRHRITWESLREPRRHDLRRTAMRVRIRNPEALEPFAVEPPTPLDEELGIRYPWEVDLVHRGDGPTSVELHFEGRLRRPSPIDVVKRYRQEVAYVDRRLGELRQWFRERDLENGTLWILVSDHGEGVHRNLGHARWAFEAQLRTLWILAGPDLPAGDRVPAHDPVLMEDVLPTVLDHLGLPTPDGLDGVSQKGCWTGDGCVSREQWWGYGANKEDGAITGVAGYRWPFKATWHRRRFGKRLHDLEQDPREHRNLSRQDPPGEASETAETLLRRLDRQRSLLQRRLQRRLEDKGRALSDEDREMLEALGYL